MGHGGRSDRMWSTREGNGKPLQYSCLENPMNTMENSMEFPQKLKIELIIWSSNSSSEYFSKEMKTQFEKDVCIPTDMEKGLANHFGILALRNP